MCIRYSLILILLIPVLASAQIGGESTFEFLNLTNSARMASLGGNQVALADETDLNVAYNNPALLREEMQNHVVTNYVNYVADVNYGYAAYALPLSISGNIAVGMHYINYGSFIEALPTGEKTGSTFTAAEYALNITYSYQYNQFSFGANLKPIWSSFETYQSAGLAVDFGASYQTKDELNTIGLVVKNLGMQLTNYYDNGEKEPLPFDIQFGASKKLGHAPIRISGTLQHLQNWNLLQEIDSDNSTTQNNNGLGKKLLQHMLLGVEILPSKNFTLRIGYNYLRRQELKFDEKLSTVGFSWGFGFKISRFQLSYGSARYHLAGSGNHISLAINLADDYSRH